METQDGGITQLVFLLMYMTTGAGVVLVGDGTTHGCGTVTDGVDIMVMDGTVLGDGTAGDGVTMVGAGTHTGVMPELVSDGAVTMEIVGVAHLTEDITIEVMRTIAAEGDTEILLEQQV